ncbi:lipase family protein [Falsiroseomonas stagni]|uniref:Uncharacterized protein n=1 Tax=Falsiroseomonas stagni DSM 19981 TaxID=1123062 RepID=A0A1I4DAD4_9PROT|nr:hypothetical protein [Falsiroseomonas stagni]SFK90764.1 hypothetical protein SAMN02745775_11096 [Falsiroseomonas stagni DSM 19981]
MDDQALATHLAGTRVLLCYGLLGEVMAGLRPLGLDYMAGQIDWLTGIGVAASVLRLPTVAPVGVNAGRIEEAALAEDGPFILVGHSKGGLEALAALLRPGMAARCRGFIALQSPFRGSPVADRVCGIRAFHLAAHHAARLFGLGTGRGVKDLTTPVRQAWMRDHAAAIASLVDAVPVATLATAIGPTPQPQDRAHAPLARWAHAPLARWLEAQGAGPNDGLVPVASALLPGARQLVLQGGHRALVASGPGRDPIGVLRAELARLPILR